MFAIPVLFVERDNSYKFYDGMLFKLPPELGGTNKLDTYSKLSKSGWHKVDYGYWNHVSNYENGERRVFIGLGLTDHPPVKQKGSKPAFSKIEFEKYLSKLQEREQEYRNETDADFNMLIHDLRRLSASIYHAAEEARAAHYGGDRDALANRLESILAAQGMLKLRTDVLDLAGNPNGDDGTFQTPVFKKVDKVVRCFRPSAEKRNIELSLAGPSHGRCLGPNVFEILPYLLIDNAIKYSPANSTIEVSCRDVEKSVEIKISSIGPLISGDEKKRIFEKGYRSVAARQGQNSGTGTGLFLAKQLVGQFNGEIWVEVDEEKIIETSGGVAQEVSFCVSVPVEKQ
ncbi:sensor histidine kinase [Shimia haliotis]|uniref:histidine kinase n=1 Tax=Shimia haliotis TaxID=1280847 RepID=A0A1I4B6Z9_9RHOB|nr:HAMP domain-containing sensor histidine kinase [Shimia haliotis]SFK64303.1 Histidine kinase-, DNA gyrase B-, and HSP90-like ATPase [Shimia haliotis]